MNQDLADSSARAAMHAIEVAISSRPLVAKFVRRLVWTRDRPAPKRESRAKSRDKRKGSR